jgi:hypothetical protein
MVIGGSISGATANLFLYSNPGGNLSQDAQASRIDGAVYQTDISANTYAQGSDDNFNAVLQADNIGPLVTPIQISGDGVSDINTLAGNWNAANPSNTISVISGGSYVLNNGDKIALTGGGVSGTFMGSSVNTGTALINLQGIGESSTGLDALGNPVSAINFSGNMSSVFGSSKFGLMSHAHNTVTNALGFISVTPEEVKLVSTDNSSYAAGFQFDKNQSFLQFDGNSLALSASYARIQTDNFFRVNSSSNQGMIESQNGVYVKLGDFEGFVNSSFFAIDIANQTIKAQANNQFIYQAVNGSAYLSLNPVNNYYGIGDISNANSRTKTEWDDGTGTILSTAGVRFRVQNTNGDLSLQLDPSADYYAVGDLSGKFQNTKTVWDDDGAVIRSSVNGSFVIESNGGFRSFIAGNGSRQVMLGDCGLSNGVTFIQIDDPSQFITLNAAVGLTISGSGVNYLTVNAGAGYTNINTGLVNKLAVHTYGSTIVLTVEDYAIVFNGSTGASTVSLPPIAIVGQIMEISDGGSIASSSNITVDAGAGGKIISTSGTGQTHVNNVDGQSFSYRCFDNNSGAGPSNWMVV